MGRDWYWRSGDKPSGRHSARTRTRTRTTLPGCITAVFHLFQSHRFHCPFNRQTSSQEEEPSTSASALLASSCKEDDSLNIPMGIQIKTKIGGPDNDTPGTNTPTLVARLMGLDLLPESHSPSFQSRTKSRYQTSSLHGDGRGGTRSLPVTPRTSSARRSDVDRHHRPRLSLQINKENVSPTNEFIMSHLSSLTKRKELKREYETVKQSVTRKVGMNITNTVRNREEVVSHFRYKKISRALTKVADNSSTVKNSTNYGSKLPESPRIQKQTSHKLEAVEEEQEKQENQQQPRAARKCKKGSNKKLVSRMKKPQQAFEITRNKKEEPFVRRPTANIVNIPDKKCRKTSLSNDLLNGKVPTLVLVKKIQQKQVLDAQSPTQAYIKRQPGQAQAISTAATGDEAECEYIARILRRTGLNKDTQVSISCFFSPSHPLDPSIFHYLERFTASSSSSNNETKCGQLSHRCNRILLFHLVDELLSEILKPCFNMKPWVNRIGFSCMDGSRLIDTLWSRIRRFPQSDCRVLEDIDALIGRDTPSVMAACEEQGEGIVAEIEKDMLEALVFELYEA